MIPDQATLDAAVEAAARAAFAERARAHRRLVGPTWEQTPERYRDDCRAEARAAVAAAAPIIAAAERDARAAERAVVDAAKTWADCRRQSMRGGDALHLACVALDDAVMALLDAQAAIARAGTSEAVR